VFFCFPEFHARIGYRNAMNIGIERQLSNQHLIACLYAGINIGGNIHEGAPSQVRTKLCTHTCRSAFPTSYFVVIFLCSVN